MVNVQYLTRISLFFEGLAVLDQIVKSGAADLEFYLKNSCNSAPLPRAMLIKMNTSFSPTTLYPSLSSPTQSLSPLNSRIDC